MQMQLTPAQAREQLHRIRLELSRVEAHLAIMAARKDAYVALGKRINALPPHNAVHSIGAELYAVCQAEEKALAATLIELETARRDFLSVIQHLESPIITPIILPKQGGAQ